MQGTVLGSGDKAVNTRGKKKILASMELLSLQRTRENITWNEKIKRHNKVGEQCLKENIG